MKMARCGLESPIIQNDARGEQGSCSSRCGEARYRRTMPDGRGRCGDDLG